MPSKRFSWRSGSGLRLAGLGALFVGLLTFAGSSHALINSVEFDPSDPAENQPLRIIVSFAGCPPPGPNIDGEVIDFRTEGTSFDLYYSLEASPCGVPPPDIAVPFDVGFLPPGDYAVRIALISRLESFPDSMDGLDPIVVPFTVGGPVARPIPTLGGVSSAVLALMILFVALRSRLSARARST